MTDPKGLSPQRRLVDATKWSAAAEFAAALAQPLVFIVLAQFLTPEDFGVATAALMVIAFSNIFWEGGLSKALIQAREDVDQGARVAFWINLALGLGIAGVLIAFSDRIATGIFGNPAIGPVLDVMSLLLVIGALQSVQGALLRRKMAFNRLFRVRIVGAVIPAFVSIPLAVLGAEYWALVAGALAAQTASAIMVWRISDWRPWPPPAPGAARSAVPLMRFGGWVMCSTLLGWLFNWGDALIIGAFLSSGDLGIYRAGSSLAAQAFSLLFLPIIPVAYSHFSSLASNPPKLLRDGSELTRMIMSATIPLGFAGFAVAGPLVGLVFGSTWAGLGSVVGVLCLAQGLSWSISMNGEIYRAAGRPMVETVFAFASATVFLVAYLISIRYGFEAFLWTRLGLAAAATLAHVLVFCAVFRTGAKEFLLQMAQSFLAGAAIVLAAHGIFAMAGDGPTGISLAMLAALLMTAACVAAGGHLASMRQFMVKAR